MRNTPDDVTGAADLSKHHSRRRQGLAVLLLSIFVAFGIALRLGPDLKAASDIYTKTKDTAVGDTEQRDSNELSEKPKARHRSSTQSAKKPNILFIMTDQQRFDAIRRVQDELPYYNNVTKIRTPNLDKLSRKGVYFRNAYTQSTVCGPARASLRTGCTIERTGLQTNGLHKNFEKFPFFRKRVEGLTTIDEVLTRNGYISEHYGKWHLPKAFWKPVQYNDYDHKNENFFHNVLSISKKYRSFLSFHKDHGDISQELGEGKQRNLFSEYPYIPSRLDARYGQPPGTDLTDEYGYADWQRTESNACGEDCLSHEYSSSHFIANASIMALQRLVKQKDPFFLTVSFVSPHPPVIAPSKYLDFYKKEQDKLFVSHNLYDDMKNSAYDHVARREPRYHNYGMIQEWTSLYYAVIEEIDDLVGELLRQLGDRKEDTLIIFTSDHGEMLGAHGKRDKNTFYEESNRIPLFMSFPSVIEPKTTVDELVSHIDVFATILDYAGLSEHDTSDGTSLRTKVEKQSYNKEYDENVVVAEWDFRDPNQGSKEKDSLDITPSLNKELDWFLSFMVRKGSYKLMLRKQATSSAIDMMFDLDEDPFEMNNLLGSNAVTTKVETREKAEHLRCLLLEWMYRMDGGDKKYYSDPVANGGEGLGDIEEVRLRQSWPELDFWKSDSRIEMGRPVWNGTHFVRNEYLYFGTRAPGQVTVQRIRLGGEDSKFFRLELSGVDSLKAVQLGEKVCMRLKITFAAAKLENMPRKYRAGIRLQMSGGVAGDEGTEHVVALRMTPSIL